MNGQEEEKEGVGEQHSSQVGLKEGLWEGGTDAFLQLPSLVPAIGRPDRAAQKELIREKKKKSIPASFFPIICLSACTSASQSDLPIIQREVPETLRHPANQSDGGKTDCGSWRGGRRQQRREKMRGGGGSGRIGIRVMFGTLNQAAAAASSHF